MHKCFVFCDQIRLADGAVRYPGAHHDDHICFIHGPVAVGFAVVAHHAEKHGIVGLHDTDAHHGADHRDLVPVRKELHLLLCMCQMDTAADTHDRPLRLLQPLEHFFDLYLIALHSGLIGTKLCLLRITEIAQLCGLYIDGNVNENRSLSSGIGNIEGLLHDAGNVLHIADAVAEFHKAFAGAADVSLLEDI